MPIESNTRFDDQYHQQVIASTDLTIDDHRRFPKTDLMAQHRSDDAREYDSLVDDFGANAVPKPQVDSTNRLATALGFNECGPDEVCHMQALLDGSLKPTQFATLGLAAVDLDYDRIQDILDEVLGSATDPGTPTASTLMPALETTTVDADSIEVAPKPEFVAAPADTAIPRQIPATVVELEPEFTFEPEYSSETTSNESPNDSLNDSLSNRSNGFADYPRDLSTFNNGTDTIESTHLNLESDGTLSEASKADVAALLTDLSAAHQDQEVAGIVYRNGDKLALALTLGEESSVAFKVPNDVVFSAHTHPSGSPQPSATDRSNLIGGEEAIVVDDQSYSYA